MADTIKIHGRSTYTAEVAITDDNGVPVDLSTKVLWFETANVGFRKRLIASTTNPKNAMIHLTVDEVDDIPAKVTDFIIRDETVPGSETVIPGGTIQRIGWVAK